MELPITANIGGWPATRDDVREWELKRAVRVSRKLDLAATDLPLAELTERLVERKLELGHAAIEELLERELTASRLTARATAAMSGARRQACTIELSSDTGRAEQVVGWYAEAMAANDELPLIAACPDHYLSRTNADGSEEIIETTGGSPFPIRMFFDSSDTASITTAADPGYPTQWVAVARAAADGRPIGGVRHQFRDRPGDGFDVILTVEFPWATLPHLITAHRWHLACEFSNWIEGTQDAG
ncbi:MAG: hypothetical protein U0R24_03725 [Solirubrobacterales bacterium]